MFCQHHFFLLLRKKLPLGCWRTSKNRPPCRATRPFAPNATRPNDQNGNPQTLNFAAL
jgi:hypothetical protein